MKGFIWNDGDTALVSLAMVDSISLRKREVTEIWEARAWQGEDSFLIASHEDRDVVLAIIEHKLESAA